MDSIRRREQKEAKKAAKEKKQEEKTRRPDNTAFRQQRLKAWDWIYTPTTVLFMLFGLGAVITLVGGLLYLVNSRVSEISLDYTHCSEKAPTGSSVAMPTDYVSSTFGKSSIEAEWSVAKGVNATYQNNYRGENANICTLKFRLPAELHPTIVLMYGLTNMYQNHRKYVSSFYPKQLAGEQVTVDNVAAECEELGRSVDEPDMAYYPCGIIANSLFNDTIAMPVLQNTQGSSSSNETFMMTSPVGWESDSKLYKKFPESAEWYTQFMPPPNWQARWPEGRYSPEFPPPDLGQDQRIWNWLRTAALPNFSKPYYRATNGTMKVGTYAIEIIDSFPASKYGGTKSIILSTVGAMGGSNSFFFLLYFIVGGIFLLAGIVLLGIQVIHPRKLGDHTHLSWNQTAKKN